MRLCYVLLSPTWGMHQYTADLANRHVGAGPANRILRAAAQGEPGRPRSQAPAAPARACTGSCDACTESYEACTESYEACTESYEVSLVTTQSLPRDRYAPEVSIHTPVATRDSGFSLDGLRRAPAGIPRVLAAIRRIDPDLVHVTGPHLWNPLLLESLRRRGVPAVHTLHDLHPHAGSLYGRLLYPWNRWIARAAGHILVHGACYLKELVDWGRPAGSVTHTPLTHLFLGHQATEQVAASPPPITYEPWALFIGRLLPYKGLDVLVAAARQLESRHAHGGHAPGCRTPGLVIAGEGRLDRLVSGSIPPNVQLRNRLIKDDEALDLFCRCGLVVLPYIEASQSALIAAAYTFRKPVIVTRAGALPEYVVPGETGWIIEPGDPGVLAETLARALAGPARLARMGDAGRAWVDHQRRAETLALDQMVRTLAGRRHN